MIGDQLLDDVMTAHEELLAAQESVNEAAARRGELVLKALAAGVGAIALAKALGVDRQRIYQIAKAAR